MQAILLAAAVIAAVSLYLLMPREKPSLAKLGLLIGALTLGGVFVFLMGVLDRTHGATGPAGSSIFFYIFAAIMIGGAVGVISHPKPVYAALYFVLVSLAGAGLFVLLLAEFMAIVLIIVYAGAILVTYVFVIMLASQSINANHPDQLPAYDRTSSEPLVAILVSFVLMGSVMQLMFGQPERFFGNNPGPHHQDALFGANANGPAVPVAVMGLPENPLLGHESTEANAAPSEIQVLGLTLYSRYALSLELAGVLLTISLVGAVMIARKNASNEHVLGGTGLPVE